MNALVGQSLLICKRKVRKPAIYSVYPSELDLYGLSLILGLQVGEGILTRLMSLVSGENNTISS